MTVGRVSSAITMPPGLEESGPIFDRATRLARAVFGDVDAQVSLVNGAELWRSRTKDDDNAAKVQSEAAAILEIVSLGELVWVEDCREDPRFCNDPSVAGPPGVRFLAGAPIRLEDGSTPGALWVAGLTPRAFDRSLAARLQDLADFLADEWARVKARHDSLVYERTMEAIVNAMPLSMVLLDRDVRILYASLPWIEGRGLSGRQVIGKTLFELRPDMFDPWREGIARCMTGMSHEVERLQIPLPGGRQGWVKVVMAPWYDHDGAVGGLIITAYDITQIVEALEQSERSEERLRLAIEIADLYVYEMDYVRGELVKVGDERAFFDTTKTYGELAADIWSTIDRRDVGSVQAQWASHEQFGDVYEPEYRVIRNDGQEIWTSGTAKLILNEAGKPVRLIGAMRDITARRSSERALVEAKEEAEAANHAKSAFLATMSHEIRTPLNGVLGMAQAMAADPDLTATQRERLDVIHQSGESLLAILNDVLDLSKIEAGKLILEAAEFELASLAKTVHATFQAIADTNGIAFELSLDRAAQGVYIGDPVRVRQILWNLVSNALKFTEKGGGESTHRPRQQQSAADRVRQRHRDDAATAEEPVPEVPAGRRHHHPAVRRYGPGPGDLSRTGRAHGRRDRGDQRAGHGLDFHGHPAAAEGGRFGPEAEEDVKDQPTAPGRDRSPDSRPRRRGQQHEPVGPENPAGPGWRRAGDGRRWTGGG